MEKIGEPKRPAGFSRLLYRMPIVFYQLGLGSLMGGRCIHLVHIGRKSGLKREAVIEVVVYNEMEDVYFLASGWGEGSDWYRNVLKTPEVEAQVGGHRFRGHAEKIDVEAAAELFSRYGKRRPRTLQSLARVMGYCIEANETEYRALGREIPVIAIHVESEHA